MKSVKQQLEENSALLERALKGDLDAQQEIDAILRKAGSSFADQVKMLDSMDRQINNPSVRRVIDSIRAFDSMHRQINNDGFPITPPDKPDYSYSRPPIALLPDAPTSKGNGRTKQESSSKPRVPKRPADFRHWQKVWKEAKHFYNARYSDQEIYDKLPKDITERCSLDLLTDIIKAGSLGYLEDSPEIS